MKPNIKNVLFLNFIIFILLFLMYYRSLFADEIYSIVDETHSNVFHSNIKTTIHDKWIVVTSVNQPTKEIARLASQKFFQLLVVGDKKTPEDWSYPNTIFLSRTDQEKIGYSILESTPLNSYNRKNIGYLFAIQNGAKYIYDTDDDNAPIIDLIDYFDLNEFDHGLVLTAESGSSSYVNPYSHFGQPTIWPRGYPLSEINKPVQVCYKFFLLSCNCKVLIRYQLKKSGFSS